MHAVDALGAAEFRALGQTLGHVGLDQRLDLLLDIVGQLIAVGAEQFYAVVVEWIVRGRNHDAEIGAHGTRQHGDGGGRHRAEQQHVHADRCEAGHQRVLDHVTGQPRVLPDHDAVAVVTALEHQPGRLPDLQRQLRGNHAVGATPNSIGPEIFASHESPLARSQFPDRASR